MNSNKMTAAEIEAVKRKERIQQLKLKAKGVKQTPEVNTDDENHSSELSLDRTNDSSLVNTNDTKLSIECEVEQNTCVTQFDDLDLNNLASRKVGWDLKRRVEKSLELLEERTREKIIEICRKRLIEETEENCK